MQVVWINQAGTDTPIDGTTPERGYRTFAAHSFGGEPDGIYFIVVCPGDYSTEDLVPMGASSESTPTTYISAQAYDNGSYALTYPGVPVFKQLDLNLFPGTAFFNIVNLKFVDSTLSCHCRPGNANVYGCTFEGPVSLSLCKGMVFESNAVDLGNFGSINITYDHKGSLTFSHNTILGPLFVPSGNRIIALEPYSYSVDVNPAYPYFQVHNNVIKRRSVTYIWQVNARENWHIDSFFFIDGNFYDYDPDNELFGRMGEESAPEDRVVSDTFLDWQQGSIYWVGKDILGSWGDAELGRDGEKFDLVWTSPCINVTSRNRLNFALDYKASNRPALGKYDLGAEEVLPPLSEYTVYGFTSKTYPTFNEGGVTTQFAVFTELLLDFPDAALAKVSFNGGSTWTTVLDTYNGVDTTEETVDIAVPDRGTDLVFKIELWIHDSNICEPDVGTPVRTDLEYFSERSIGTKFPAGTELDIYDFEFNPVTRIVAGRKAKFETWLAPGTYQIKASGGGVPPVWRQVDVGHGTWFGRYSEEPGSIWHQFHKAQAWGALQGIQWGRFMFWDQFADDSLRMSQASGCPPLNTGEDYWPLILFVRQGKALKNRSGWNSIFIVTDPSVW